jgi:hypothetical protein
LTQPQPEVNPPTPDDGNNISNGRCRERLRPFQRGAPTLRPLPASSRPPLAHRPALAGAPSLIGADRHDPGSVDAVITSYLNSKSFTGLALTTQRMRRALHLWIVRDPARRKAWSLVLSRKSRLSWTMRARATVRRAS